MEDDVGQQVGRLAEVVAVDGGIEGCVLLVGEGIQVASYLFNTIDNMKRIPASRPLEGDVLAEMC